MAKKTWYTEYEGESGEHLTFVRYGDPEEAHDKELIKEHRTFAAAKAHAARDYTNQIDSLQNHLSKLMELKASDVKKVK